MKKTLILLVIITPLSLQAVSLTGQQTATNEWTYTLTFDPFDNYSICQPSTTITLAGLSHVVGAAPPTTTDLPGSLDEINTNWTAEVLADGLGARWTHLGSGTGNWSDPRHVYGFRVFANGATNGPVFLSTSGISLDTGCPLPDGANRDITSYVEGPTDTNTVAVGLSPQNPPLTGNFAITVIGTPGRTYRLQAASVLPATNWDDVFSFTLPFPITNIVDVTATNFPIRFYRVTSP